MTSLLYNREHAEAAIRSFTQKPVRFETNSEEEFPMRSRPTNAEMDNAINHALEELLNIRHEMTLMFDQRPVCMTDLADLFDTAKRIYKRATFDVRRHSHYMEEGIRVRREREYQALNGLNLSPFMRCVRKMQICITYNIEERVSEIEAWRDQRLAKLEVAFEKIQRHHLLMGLSEGFVTN